MKWKRVIGEYKGAEDGPLLICTGGIHGNELAGVNALTRLFEKLEKWKPTMKGTVVGLSGNISALEKNQRFIERDLNRIWEHDHMDYIRSTHADELYRTEDKEQKALYDHMQEYLEVAPGRTIYLDLHTTSASGGVFTIASDTEKSVRLAQGLLVPVIVGLDEVLHGTTLNYFQEIGIEAIGFEAGQHHDPIAVDNAEAAILVLLVSLGCLQRSDIPEYEIYEQRLLAISAGLPEVVQFRYRHDIKQDDHFEMKPGFGNFQTVEQGMLLANDIHGEIRAQEDGMILMPLYQPQGEDGFFIIKPLDF